MEKSNEDNRVTVFGFLKIIQSNYVDLKLNFGE